MQSKVLTSFNLPMPFVNPPANVFVSLLLSNCLCHSFCQIACVIPPANVFVSFLLPMSLCHSSCQCPCLIPPVKVLVSLLRYCYVKYVSCTSQHMSPIAHCCLLCDWWYWECVVHSQKCVAWIKRTWAHDIPAIITYVPNMCSLGYPIVHSHGQLQQLDQMLQHLLYLVLCFHSPCHFEDRQD